MAESPAQLAFRFLMANKVLVPYMDPFELSRIREQQRLEVIRLQREAKDIERKAPTRKALQHLDTWWHLYDYAIQYNIIDMEDMYSEYSRFACREFKKRRLRIMSIIPCAKLTNKEIVALCVEAGLPHFWLD